MRLAELLAEATTEELERLSHEHARADELMSRPQLLDTIESVLRSFRFLQEFLLNRQPPSFAIITLLLDAPGFSLASDGFRDAVIAETKRLSEAIDSGTILKRDDQLRVYRRVLYQARSNDMRIDSSESAILSVLRQELEVATVEHFLIEHHADLREFWQQDAAFVRELHALRSAGIVFAREGRTMLAEDLAPVIRNVLGIDMPRDAARRLYNYLNGQELHEALTEIGAPTSGSKEDRVERLVAHMAQPKAILRRVGLETLRAVCKKVGAQVSGSKQELVDRVVSHIGLGRDLQNEPVPPPPPVSEPRALDEARFALMFERLRGHELAAILSEFQLRRWGTKELQIRTAWEANRSESTLLGCLTNSELDGILKRLDLKPGGSKADRIGKLVENFATRDVAELRRSAAPPAEGPDPDNGNAADTRELG